MNKKNNIKVLKFPSTSAQAEREIEAILFAAEEPLDIETIKSRMKAKTDPKKVLESLEQQYKNRGINLVCIANKWSFRTSLSLTKLMSLQKTTEKKLSKAAIESLAIIVSVSYTHLTLPTSDLV